MCVDYRWKNEITQNVVYPMPRIDECLDPMREARIFTKMDLRSGFHLILIFTEHRGRTAFQTRWGTFQYTVIPFGLCNAPATFQRTMNSLFHEFHQFCEVYIDDIVIFSKTVAEHASDLRLVRARLEREKFHAKPSKCLFAVPCIDFCGFQVSAAGIATQPDKIALIRNWPNPTSVKEVRSFLGVFGF